MKKRKVEGFIFYKQIYDNPVVPVPDDLEKAIRGLKVRVGKLGTMTLLKRRRDFPTVAGRRRFKRLRSIKKIQKERKEGRR